MKKKLIMPLIAMFTPLLLVGGGFSIFIFSNNAVSESSNVTISIEKSLDYGEIRLVYLKDGQYLNELDNVNFKTYLELGYEDALLIRNDNPSIKRSFIIEYIPPLESLIDVSLNVKLTLKDTDSRGISFASPLGENNPYPISSSLLDIISPKRASLHGYDDSSVFNEVESLPQQITYQSKLVQFSPTVNERFQVSLEFSYLWFNETYLGKPITGSFSPSYHLSRKMLEEKMKSNIEALNNCSIDISFYLEGSPL